MTERPFSSLGKKIGLLGLGFILFVLLIAAVFGPKGFIEITRVRRQHAALVQEIERLKDEKARLEKEIAELEKNPDAVEKEAREKLGLIKPDEKVIFRKVR
jgi:cell division protein FtsB